MGKPKDLQKAKKAENFMPRSFILTDRNFVERFFCDLEFYHEFKDEAETDEASNNDEDSTTISSNWTKTCTTCKVEFDDLQEQRQHFKLDWHRYNLKKKISGNPDEIINEEQFNNLIDSMARKSGLKSDDKDDIDSLSGSDSEEEEETRDHYLRQPKLYLINSKTEEVFSLHRVLVHPGKGHEVDSTTILDGVCRLPLKLKWAILMLGGGHFAGAVFQGQEILVHKTFHCYTVRAKQGGGQSSADNKSGTAHPKSAGSSLRRYNEASLANHVKDIVKTWSDHFKDCHLIFYRAASGNKKLLFGNSAKEAPILDKHDERVRNIPFPTRRATLKEVKRVHELLITVDVVGNRETIDVERVPRKSPSKENTKKRIRRSESGGSPRRELPDLVMELAKEVDDENHDSLAYEVQLQSNDLVEFEVKYDEDIETKNELVTACMTGNLKRLTEILPDSKKEFLTEKFGDSKSTLLHLGSKSGHPNIVAALLNHGADPLLKDKQKKTPYMVSLNKDTRNAFRRFQAENFDAFDWLKASIPTSDLLTPEEEARQEAKKKEKKKLQRQAKKLKDQMAKKEQQEELKEKQEKENFLNLSDREKRALAAERRLMTSGSDANVVKQRCFKCGVDITGKVPFEYGDYRFCSPGCVKEHRKNSK